MFDPKAHKIVLVKILKMFYDEPSLRTILGFKGGTAAYLFYDLPRISVDLDFDLLDVSKKTLVLKRICTTLMQFGTVKEAIEKRYTLFFLLSYKKGERNIKVEISKRSNLNSYAVKSYLGIPVLLIVKKDLLANKLLAFLTRKKFASRDLFDLWFFLQKGWKINEKIIQERMGLKLKDVLETAIKKVEGIKQNMLLQGMGELFEEKDKKWVKEKLKTELTFYLKLYLDNL